MKILLLAILILCQTAAFAQSKKFRWSTELCEFEGTYDSKKYTETELKNTFKLWFDVYSNYNLKTEQTAWKIEDVAKLSVDALDKEYELKSAELKNLDIINSPFWETRRRTLLSEMEKSYQLSRITIQAYGNPAILREYKSADVCLTKFGNPLINGGDELLTAWRQVNEESRRQNADPERLRVIFDRQYNSPEKYKHAQIEVMMFGWWNCAIAQIEREHTEEAQEKEFKKAFKRVRNVVCDEP